MTDTLTKEEVETCKLLAQGLTNKQVGDRLFKSSRTIESRRRKMCEKLRARNTVSLIVKVIQLGYIKVWEVSC